MVIEINKDIDRYQESVALGLSAKQLVFSIASVAVGGTLVLLLYKYIGLTGAAYVAIPCVAPIALGGFYSYNGMDFYEYMGKKLRFMFSNHPLVYMSTEGELAIREYQMELLGTGKKKKGKAGKKQEVTETRTDAQKAKNQEEFEAMKKKTKRLLFASIGVMVAAVAGIMAYKYMQ
ncbi:MAG: PrgI family protein [Anaerostipes sp.]|uniref:PrgI family protein n=1 Tax=Enterocloster bolteae TaxID=208479 RepID=UPI00210A9118|nr:PrgI family protein [Enterocloster bolteae]MCQ4756937.1 PrgI family protein [Enterocloster bolteae]MDD4370715.1 PrgI family protein [Anaerostipes sp.]